MNLQDRGGRGGSGNNREAGNGMPSKAVAEHGNTRALGAFIKISFFGDPYSPPTG